MRVYQSLALKFQAWLNCQKTGNQEWQEKHEEAIKELINSLPHGSGIDGETTFDFEKSKPDRLVINSSYHHMNDNGMYDGWSDHTIIITPSLSFDFNLRIGGTFPKKYQSTKEYLLEIFGEALNREGVKK